MTITRSQSVRSAQTAAICSAEVFTTGKESRSDDAGMESLSIEKLPEKRNAPTAADGEGSNGEADTRKRKISEVEERGTRAPTSGPGTTTCAVAMAKNKGIRKSPRLQSIAAKTGSKDAKSGHNLKSAAMAKSNTATAHGDCAKGEENDSRGGPSKKSLKESIGVENGSVAKIPSTQESAKFASRSLDEDVVAMRARIKELEIPNARNTGKYMVNRGQERIQRAKEMLQEAHDLLKHAQEIVREGSEVLKNSL